MKRSSLRALSFIVIFCFGTAQVTLAVPSLGINALPEAPRFMQIDIPSDLASVEEIYQANPNQNPSIVLYIQNAHGSYEAQMKIKKLLEYLYQTYGFKLLFVEGAAEKLQPEYLRLFPDPEHNAKLADYLTQQGQLTGAENYLIDGPKDVEAIGIEQPDLYRNNYEKFKAVHAAKAQGDRFLSQLEQKLQTLSSKVFSSDAKRLLSEWKKFESGQRGFLPYIQGIAQESKKVLGIDLESLFAQVEWPQVTRLLVLQSMEKDLNRTEAEKERIKLLSALREKQVSENLIEDVKALGERKIQLRSMDSGNQKKDSPRFLLERLIEEAGPKGFRFHDYPSFSLYAGYLILQSELESRRLFEEIEMIFQKILDELTTTELEKNLLEMFRDLELLKKLLHLELTRAEWSRVAYREDWIHPEIMGKRLATVRDDANGNALHKKDRRQPVLKTITEDEKMSPEDGAVLNDLFRSALDFYGYAKQREAVFHETIVREMRERNIQKAVLITGGFHTEGVVDLLKQDEISYGILMPKITQQFDQVNYLSTMLDQHPTAFDLAMLEMVLKGKALRFQLAQGMNAVKDILDRVTAFLKVADLTPDSVRYFDQTPYAAERRLEMRIIPEQKTLEVRVDGSLFAAFALTPGLAPGTWRVQHVLGRAEMRAFDRRDFLKQAAQASAAALTAFGSQAQAMDRAVQVLGDDELITGLNPSIFANLWKDYGLQDRLMPTAPYKTKELNDFKDQLVQRKIVRTVKGLKEWLSLLKMIRALAAEMMKDLSLEDARLAKGREVTSREVTQSAVALWRLMGQPSLDQISLVSFMPSKPVTLMAGGQKVTLQARDFLLRAFAKQLLKEMYLSPAYLEKAPEAAKLFSTIALNQLGVSQEGAFDKEQKVLAMEYFFQRHAGPFVTEEEKKRADTETFSFVSPYFSSGHVGFLADQHSKLDKDLRASVKPARFVTIGDLELYAEAQQYLIQLSESYLADRSFARELAEVLKRTQEVAKQMNWGKIHRDFADPKALSPVPLDSGDISFFSGWLMGIYQRAQEAAQKGADAYREYLIRVFASEMDQLKKDFRAALLNANTPMKYGSYYNRNILKGDVQKKLTLIDRPIASRFELRAEQSWKEDYVRMVRENNPALPLQGDGRQLNPQAEVAMLAGGIIEEVKSSDDLQFLASLRPVQSNQVTASRYQEVRNQIGKSLTSFNSPDSPGILGAEIDGRITAEDLKSLTEAIAGILVLRPYQGIQLFMAQKNVPQARRNEIRTLEKEIQAVKDAEGNPIGSRFGISFMTSTSQIQRGLQQLANRIYGLLKAKNKPVDLTGLQMRNSVFLTQAGSAAAPEVQMIESSGVSDALVRILESVVGVELSQAGSWDRLSNETKRALDASARRLKIISEGLAELGAATQIVTLLKAAYKIAISA